MYLAFTTSLRSESTFTRLPDENLESSSAAAPLQNAMKFSPSNQQTGRFISPQTKNSVHGGVCLSAYWDPAPGPGRHPPKPDRHPPGTRQAPPGTRQAPPGPGRHPPPRAKHAGRYSQRAGVLHPTEMQSFLFNFCVLK